MAKVYNDRQKRADAALALLIEENPGCTVNEDGHEWMVGTNCVTFGTFEGQPVVFKYCDWQPRKEHEEIALRLFAPSELIPKLYPIKSDSVLVMERLRGSTLHNIEQQLELSQLPQLYYQLGQAVAKLVEAAPGSQSGGRRDLSAKLGFDYQFYCQADIGSLFDTVTERAAKILTEKDVPDKSVLGMSLSALRRNRDAILAYPTFVQMDDFHTSNIMVDGTELTGFIDLEMTRYGNEVLVLAAVLAMMQNGRPERWDWIRRGYEDGQGEPIDDDLLFLACIAAPFSQWTRFMWYWGTDDPPQWVVKENLRVAAIRDIKKIVNATNDIEL
jgi:hypothetical protein